MTSEQQQERGQWGSQIEFLLTCLGYAVGLGNVWRFPYLCGRSGGAAFLVPYLIMMIFAGLPVFYMELSLGQFAQTTPALLYSKMAPIAAGLGPAMVIAQTYFAMYYNMIIAWSIHYLFNTFRSPLPWSHCDNEFNTFRCYDDVLQGQCEEGNTTYYTGRCHTSEELSQRGQEIEHHWMTAVREKFVVEDTIQDYLLSFSSRFQTGLDDEGYLEIGNKSMDMVENIFQLTGRWSPTKEYLYIRMLNISEGIEPEFFGAPLWELALCLLAAWVLVFLCLVGGTKTSGKVVYFTATFPYIILIILFFRGITLGEGIGDGLKFFLVPNMTQLGNPKAWGDAANQIFFSLSLGGGGLTTIASYNKFHNNLFRDTLIVVLSNCATSFFAGLVIFPVVGFIANELHQDVGEIAEGGVALAFQVYPHAINRMALPQLWAFLFFFMLVLLGIDSQMVAVETPITAIMDRFPVLRTRKRKTATVAIFCTFGFVVGLALTTPGGSYLLTLLDTYAGGWSIIIAAALELVLVTRIYGYKNFISDVRLMLGDPPTKFYKLLGYPVNLYWVANWVFITPALLFFILLFNIVQFKRSKSGDYTFPIAFDLLGWVFALSCIAPIPILALYNVISYKQEGKPWRSLFRPTEDWGPGDPDAAAAAGGYPRKDRMNRKSVVHPQPILTVSDTDGTDLSTTTTTIQRHDIESPNGVGSNGIYDIADRPITARPVRRVLTPLPPLSVPKPPDVQRKEWRKPGKVESHKQT